MEVGPTFVGRLVFAQLVSFVALLRPAIVGISLKVQKTIPLEQQTTAVSIIGDFGALAATLGTSSSGASRTGPRPGSAGGGPGWSPAPP